MQVTGDVKQPSPCAFYQLNFIALTQSTRYRNNRFASEYYNGYSELFCELVNVAEISSERFIKKLGKKKQKRRLSSSRGSKIVNQSVPVLDF